MSSNNNNRNNSTPKSNKIYSPIKGTEITAASYYLAKGTPEERAQNPSRKTHLSFRGVGEIPRSLPNGQDINTTNTSNLVLPKRVEGMVSTPPISYSESDVSSVNSVPLSNAPLRTSQLDPNSRTGLVVPPMETGWWRPSSSTRNMARNEIIITQHHGPQVNPLVEAISTIAKGDMPYNFQMIQTIDNTVMALQTERNLSGTKLSPIGSKISLDLEDVLSKLRTFILAKNGDEKLQQLFQNTKSSAMHTGGIVIGLGNDPNVRNKLKPDEQMKGEVASSLNLAKQLGRDIIASGDFRSLVVEMIRTIQEISSRNVNPKAKSMKKEWNDVLYKFERGDSFSSLSKQVKEAIIPNNNVGGNLYRSSSTSSSSLPSDQLPLDPNTNLNNNLNGDISLSLTPDQQDRLAKRLRMLLARFGSNPNFRTSATNLYHLVESMLDKTSQVLEEEGGAQSVKSLKEREDVRKSWDDLKELIERFTGGMKLDTFIELLRELVETIKTDEVAKQWLRDFKAYAKTVWNAPQIIETDLSVNESKDLIRRARVILSSERYHAKTEAIAKESRLLLKQIKRDPQRLALSKAFSKLTDDTFYTGGSFSTLAFQESAAQLRYLLLPLISKQLEHIEIPQIEIYTQTHDFAARNLIFSGAEILPHNITLNMESGMNLNVRDQGTNYARAKVQMTIRNIKLEVKNVDFYLNRKVFPKLSDHGRLEMAVGGEGLSVMIEWSADLTSGEDFKLECVRAACGIDKLDVKINHSTNPLVKAGASLFKNKIKKALEKVITENLIGGGIRASEGISAVVRRRRETRSLRLKKAAIKREAKIQRRIEKESQIKAKKMLKAEKKLMQEKQRQLVMTSNEREMVQNQPLTSVVEGKTAAELIAERTAGLQQTERIPAIGQVGEAPLVSKQPLSYVGRSNVVIEPQVGSPILVNKKEHISPIMGKDNQMIYTGVNYVPAEEINRIVASPVPSKH